MKAIKMLFRIFSFPFYLALITLASIRTILINCALWLRYGGETMRYDKKFNPNAIGQMLKDNQDRAYAEILGSELEFISEINRDGSGTEKVIPSEYLAMMQKETFRVYCLSISRKTFLASNFNWFVVKLKK